MSIINRITLLVFLSLFSCKKTPIQSVSEKVKKHTLNVVDKVIDKNNFIKIKWEELNYINNDFHEFTSLKKEDRRYVKLLNNKEAIIVIMEPTKYNLDSIQATENSIILYKKGGGWIYKFKWIDKKRHIGRWDYIYNKTVIDSSFSMYVVNEKYIDGLSKN